MSWQLGRIDAQEPNAFRATTQRVAIDCAALLDRVGRDGCHRERNAEQKVDHARVLLNL